MMNDDLPWLKVAGSMLKVMKKRGVRSDRSWHDSIPALRTGLSNAAPSARFQILNDDSISQ